MIYAMVLFPVTLSNP